MTIRKYVDWHNIFLDTSIILALFRSLRDETDDVCNFVNKVITQLTHTKSSSRKDRTFYISSITISEILERTHSEKKAAKIVKALDSDNVIFYPYDNDVAEFVVRNYHQFLGTENLTKLARDLSWPEHHLNFGRQWIEKDLMIIGSANYLRCDTILTIDKNTMLPLSERVDYFCASCYPENFELSTSGKNIFNYNRPKSYGEKDKKAEKTKRG